MTSSEKSPTSMRAKTTSSMKKTRVLWRENVGLVVRIKLTEITKSKI
jgi:hypothetical protein